MVADGFWVNDCGRPSGTTAARVARPIARRAEATRGYGDHPSLFRAGQRHRIDAVLEEQAAKDGKPIADLRVGHLESVAKLSRVVGVKHRRLAIASFEQELGGKDNRPIL